MRLYKTLKGILLEQAERFYQVDMPWDELINRDDLHGFLRAAAARAGSAGTGSVPDEELFAGQVQELSAGQAAAWCTEYLLAPIGSQEVWAAGVTYLRSRDARMEESKVSGASDFYDKVYEAERPELFFKALPHRVADPGKEVYIRRDSTWNVPEPELTLYINAKGTIQGYTIGNDMSSRSIEGENPLYLPQAKMYENSASLGPCLYVPEKPLSPGASIHMKITRSGKEMYSASVEIGRMKRTFTELVSYLYREFDFAPGCFLMTGTCLVPPNDFTLQEKDRVEIRIDGIGELVNTIGYKPGSACKE
jgi:2-dehydro-3-deoxy-D-arabinonate dehydratase